MSSLTTAGRETPPSSDSINRFRSALIRRLRSNKDKETDAACRVLAEEFLEEAYQSPDVDPLHDSRCIREGEEAMSLLEEDFWEDFRNQAQEHKNKSFPETKGVLFEAVLSGWEDAHNVIGVKRAKQVRFARFVAGAINEWDQRERTAALTKLREALKNVNPPVGWVMVCHFLDLSKPEDDHDVVQSVGRAFGHLGGQENLAIAVRAILKADPYLKNAPRAL